MAGTRPVHTGAAPLLAAHRADPEFNPTRINRFDQLAAFLTVISSELEITKFLPPPEGDHDGHERALAFRASRPILPHPGLGMALECRHALERPPGCRRPLTPSSTPAMPNFAAYALNYRDLRRKARRVQMTRHTSV